MKTSTLIQTCLAGVALAGCPAAPPPTPDGGADSGSSTPDVTPQPDASSQPDVMSQPDVASQPDATSMRDASTDATSDAASMCTAGLSSCAGSCVDLQNSATNCGSCGNACPAGQVCRAGACGVACAAGQMRCGGACVDTVSNNSNCGACGRTCGAREHCAMSTCVSDCPAGQTACGGVCLDTLTDNNNCGACGWTCSPTARCVMGSCQPLCPAGQTSCGGACVDTSTNNSHCGACGMVCAAGTVCSMGRCAAVCAAPTMLCSGACVDTTSSPSNCGACGTVCPGGANAAARCASSRCDFTCNPGFGNCDGSATNGCETNTQSSLAHCGGCGRACVAGANQSAACGSGACALTCNAGFGDCDGNGANGCETNTTNAVAHCGRCGNPCVAPTGGTASCAAGTCSSACPAGQRSCGAAPGRCVDTNSDAANCGACGNACPGGQSCVMGACRAVCPAGQTACGASMTCVSLDTDSANCGRCGNACGAGQSCIAGSCFTGFRVTNLSASACVVAPNEDANGDQRSNVVAGATRAFVNADQGMANGPASGSSTVSTVNTIIDGAITNIETNTSFRLGDANGPVEMNTGVRNVDRLFRLNYFGSWTVASPLMLSQPIALNTSAINSANTGIYSGWGRGAVHTANVYEIDFSTGEVTDRGPMAQPPKNLAESFATTGIYEMISARPYITSVDSVAISRTRVPDGARSIVRTFTAGHDGAHLAVRSNGASSRWFMRFEGSSDFGNVAEGLVSCPATIQVDLVFGTFRVDFSAATATCTTVDTVGIAGDDRGPIAITTSGVLLAGDTGTVHASPFDTLAIRHAVSELGDHVIYNVRNGAVFGLFADAMPVQMATGTMNVNRVVPLDENTLRPSSAPIALSRAIPVDTTTVGTSSMVFNGWDRTVILTGGRAYNINLNTGDVADLGATLVPTHSACEGWAPSGIVETTGSNTDLVFVESSTRISRVRLGSMASTSVSPFSNLGDMNSIAFSAAQNRWYWQVEGVHQFSASAPSLEYFGSCTGAFSN